MYKICWLTKAGRQEEFIMQFNEVLEEVRSKIKDVDISGVGFLAVQVNLTGEASGVFYVEIKDGRVNVEPYEYIDRSCGLTISGENFLKLISRKLDPVAAYTTGKLKVDGDVGKALEFSRLLK